MEFPTLDKNASEPSVDQLVGHYQSAIEHGQFRPGDRLPTIRELAAQSGLSRSAVQDAYRRLQAMGLVQSQVGRGTMVTSPRPGRDEKGAAAVLSPGARAAWQYLLDRARVPSLEAPIPVVANFADLYPDQDFFPVTQFQASLERVLSERGRELLSYGEPTGDLALRETLAAGADASEVLVTNGAQQGIDLVLRAFARPGDTVAVAVPTYHHLFGLLKSHGLQILPLRSGPDGLSLDDLEQALARPDLRLLYLMPTFHNPTGRSMDGAQRAAVMERVQETAVPVLEDEFEQELRFAGEPQEPLRSMDRRGQTVTVRTFSKGLFPGVRLGWIHARADILGPMAALKRFSDLETSPLLQAAILDFIESGAMEEHLRSLCAEIKCRHEAAQAALAEHMPEGSSWTRPEGGFALWVEGPEGLDDELLAQAAARQGVLVTPGRAFHPEHRPVAGVRLSISRTSVDEVRRGIEVLGRCAKELARQSCVPAQQPFFL